MANWTYTHVDRKLAEEIGAFLPDELFDAHAHTYRVADLKLSEPSLFSGGPEEVSVDVWRETLGRLVGRGRLVGGLFMGMWSLDTDLDASNRYLIGQVSVHPLSRCSITITPRSNPATVAGALENPQVVGFKPYHIFSTERPTFNSSIGGFLPEWAWEMADDRGLVITLHMVKDAALADPENQRYIKDMCTRYPHARLILAHAARGFHAPNTVKGVRSIGGLKNVWFDLSAICEAAPIMAILREFGPSRVMWGSDFPVSQQRGRAVTIGDNFAWVAPDHVDSPTSPECHPTLVGIESLRALYEASDYFGLSHADLQDIFCNNARRLLGLEI